MSPQSPTSRTRATFSDRLLTEPSIAAPDRDRDRDFRIDTVRRLQSLEARVETLLAALSHSAKPRPLAPPIDRQILAIAIETLLAALSHGAKPRPLAQPIDRQILSIVIEEAFNAASDAQLARPGEFLIDRLALLGLEISRARPLT